MENKEETDKEAKKLVERVSTAAFFLQGQIEQANRHYETAFHTLEASRRYLERVEKNETRTRQNRRTACGFNADKFNLFFY